MVLNTIPKLPIYYPEMEENKKRPENKTMKVYDLFYNAKAPEGIEKKKAYIVGGGLAGLAAASFSGR